MIRIIEGGAYLKVEADRAEEVKAISNEIKYKNPRAWYSPAYQLYLRTRKNPNPSGWDGYMRPLRTAGSKGAALRGWRDSIIEAAEKLEIEVDRSALFVSPFEDLEIDDIPDDIIQADFELDDDQKTCVMEWLRNGIGVNKVTVSGGKTAIYSCAFAMIKRNAPDARALYLTQTERLLKQVVKETRKFLPGLEIGQFGGGKKEFDAKDMVVATTMSLSKHFEKLNDKGWFKTFTALLADEVHHVGTGATLQAVAKAIPAAYRLGASDSMKEDDIMARSQILGLIGPRLHEISAAPLIASGRIAKPHIYLIDVPEWDGRYKTLTHIPPLKSKALCLLDGEWKKGIYLGNAFEKDPSGNFKLDNHGEKIIKPSVHRIKIGDQREEIDSRWCLLDRIYDRAIIRFKARNEMVCAWTKFFTETYGQTLVICTRTTHVYILEAMLQEILPKNKIGILFSKHTGKQRDESFEWFKKTKGAVLISPLVKEGVSIPEIRAGIVADYVAGWEVFNQLIGRMIRQKKSGKNEAHIAAFIDRQNPKYRLGCEKVFTSLQRIRGYDFYHPVGLPDSISSAKLYKAASQ